MNLTRISSKTLVPVLALLACSSDKPLEQTAIDPATHEAIGVAGQDLASTNLNGALITPAEAQLIDDVKFLASDALGGREEGTAGHQLAQDYIVRRLRECGVEPVGNSWLQPIVGGTGTNILGVIPGTDSALRHRHVLISAHYDHIGECGGAICNGASDNAAGVAALIGVACHIASAPLPRSVLVAAWDSEEPPTFLTSTMGSQYYVDNPLVPLADTDVAIVLDLMGSQMWPGFQGHFVLGAELSPEVGAAVDSALVPNTLPLLRAGLHLVEETSHGHNPWSDYHPFRQAGVPVLFLSDGQNKRYHTPDDDISGLDLTKLIREAKVLYSITANLAHATQTPAFDAQGADHARDASTTVRLLEAALARGGLVETLALGSAIEAALQRDLRAAQDVERKIANGTPLDGFDIRALQVGLQRVKCLSAPRPVNACLML